MLGLCEAWHHHMMHPGVSKQALDMQRRFEIDQIGLYNAIKKVRKGCLVCQACNPDNRNVMGEAQWSPAPDQPMRSVAMDVFSMPEVHIGKETFDCVVLCVDQHSGYVVAVPAPKKGLLAEEMAVMMIHHWLTVFGIFRTICSDCGPQFTGGWFKAMCSLMGIRHAKSVAYLSRSDQGWKRRRIYTRNVYIRVFYRENTIQYVSSRVAADWRQTRVPRQSKQTLPRIDGANVRYFIEFAMNLI